MERGERVVTIVRRDAMDATALFDEQHQTRYGKGVWSGRP
jgi:hypothetical protein